MMAETPALPEQPAHIRALAVVVLYETAPHAIRLQTSKTLDGLAQAFAGDPSLRQRLDVLLWDNSPAPLTDPVQAFPFVYRHAPSNEGVAGAYNAATAMAADHRCDWLLLLDDDTSVNGDFLRGMLDHVARIANEERVAAVVPYLYAGTFCMSPRLWRFARHIPLPRAGAPYIEARAVFAANSGSLMRVRALQAVGGYSRRFWLDYSDIEMFHRLHAQGFLVKIASDVTLEHEMAMLDYDARMTPARYATYLAAESDFLDLYRGRLERTMHLARLAVRVFRQRRYRDPAFSQMSRRTLIERLTTRRAKRLARSDAANRERPAGARARRG